MKRALVLVSCVACGDTPVPERPLVFGGDRPASLHTPTQFDETRTYPLVMVLHGYGASGLVQEAYFGMRAEADAGDAFTIAPDGLVDSFGFQYWNADAACCDKDGTNPDDVGYLGSLLDDVRAAWPISQVYLVGHSNGAFMSYRMACERPDAVSAIAVLAGLTPTSVPCEPETGVSVLHMHGTADATIPFEAAMPSAMHWAEVDGCAATAPAAAGSADFDTNVVGDETSIATFDCPAPFGVELWTLTGSTHVPSPTAAFEPAIFGWLEDHAR